ncbi:MAG TPA: MBL fold metallo-hydrolase [Terriglobia bacterium]|nr:MBL fold metallo-hydrolase [Terriglobia bacterium]
MKKQKHLRLSLYTAPELSIGRAPLTPQNCQFDPKRVRYLEGMVAYLNTLFETHRKNYSEAEARVRLEKSLAQLPYSELVQFDPDQNPSVTENPGARDRIGFNKDRLRITFLDGFRRCAESPSIQSGELTPVISGIVARLSRGLTESDLCRILRESDVDLASVIEGLRNFGMIEEVDPTESIVPLPLLEGNTDRLSWLGHACVLFQTARSSICVDPFLRPHIRWTERDLMSSFSDSYGDRFFFEPYSHQLKQLSPAQLPPIDAVFITHQDIDHCNLGVLMMLPEDIPIIVPDYRADRMWETDLMNVIHNILGKRRKVIRLAHGETMTIGDIRATAFPFFSEMPSSLQTSWNCYLFETSKSAVACTADSAITDESIEFLITKLRGQSKPFTLCARSIHSGKTSPGFRDETESLFNFSRLWAWYMPIWDMFQPVEESGVSVPRFQQLSQQTNFRFYLPYAMGTAPWFRISDTNDPLYIPMANLSAQELQMISGTLKAIPGGPSLFPGKFGRPFSLTETA